jgi:hypothetical protein
MPYNSKRSIDCATSNRGVRVNTTTGIAPSEVSLAQLQSPASLLV